LQGVVDSVGQIGESNRHCQLDNLILGIIFPYIFQNVGVDGGRPTRNNIRKSKGDFFLFIKGVAALVKPQRLYLFAGNAGLLRRSSVGEGSVAAVVYAGCFQIGQLLVFGIYFSCVHDRIVKLNECFQGCRKPGDDPKDIGYPADVFLNLVVNLVQLGRRLLFGKRLWNSHWISPFFVFQVTETRKG
jgi:hypothetical protein